MPAKTTRNSSTLKSAETALRKIGMAFPEPTGYGLGRSGWVSASFGKKDKVPVALLGSWLRESYLAIAPKRIAALLKQ